VAATLTGGCFCGAVRYSLEAGADAEICHCRDCRRAAGVQSVAWLTVPRAGFAWTWGAPRRLASSPGVVRTHCADCGTSLTFERVGAPGIDVTVGSLDDPEAMAPGREIWLDEKVSWEVVDPGRAAHRRGGG
jgi:hypothetical protein